MKHTLLAQGAFYSIDVQKIYDKTMELVKGNSHWEKNWEKVANWIQEETAKHKTFDEAIKAVKKRMKKCGWV